MAEKAAEFIATGSEIITGICLKGRRIIINFIKSPAIAEPCSLAVTILLDNTKLICLKQKLKL